MYRIYRFMYGLVGFSRSQTNGFLVFLPLLLVILFSEPVFRRIISLRDPDYSRDIARLDSIMRLMEPAIVVEPSALSGALVPFDPNLASAEMLEGVGLRKEVVSRIINYRTKGGKFRVKKDLRKIWGMDSLTYARVESFLLLPENPERKPLEIESFVRKETSPREKVLREDLNRADTSSLKKVFGIGEKLALRILKYRDALGGFVSMNQLKEVYRLDTAVISRLNKRFYIEESFVPRRLNINEDGRQDLAAHPYLSPRVADAIVAYRFNHGDFKTIEDLRRIPAIDSIVFQKAHPYLKLANP